MKLKCRIFFLNVCFLFMQSWLHSHQFKIMGIKTVFASFVVTSNQKHTRDTQKIKSKKLKHITRESYLHEKEDRKERRSHNNQKKITKLQEEVLTYQ